ncbi:MAG: type II toxin-antitoxin system RelE/ParE family toxin [Pseudomonadota bacterium]
MSFKLQFHVAALEEWRRLGGGVREQLKKKLAERLQNPRVPSAALHGMADCYKIKLRSAGLRLIYRVDDGVLTVFVLALGKRERNQVYAVAQRRLG